MVNVRSFVVRLDCGHTLEFPNSAPAVDDVIYCYRHRANALVETVNAEYRVSCQGCTYGKKHGAALMTAQHDADRHGRAYPTHTVWITQAGKIVEVRHPKLTKLPSSVDSVPPF